ncbi:hypothetical protein HaLaN_13441, partial [Haematococcus lacustris]
MPVHALLALTLDDFMQVWVPSAGQPCARAVRHGVPASSQHEPWHADSELRLSVAAMPMRQTATAAATTAAVTTVATAVCRPRGSRPGRLWGAGLPHGPRPADPPQPLGRAVGAGSGGGGPAAPWTPAQAHPRLGRDAVAKLHVDVEDKEAEAPQQPGQDNAPPEKGEHHWLPPASLAVRAGNLEDVMQHGQLLVVDLDHVHNNPPSTSQRSATTFARDASASIAGQLDKCLRSCVDPVRH